MPKESDCATRVVQVYLSEEYGEVQFTDKLAHHHSADPKMSDIKVVEEGNLKNLPRPQIKALQKEIALDIIEFLKTKKPPRPQNEVTRV